MRHSIQINPSRRIFLQLLAEVPCLPLEQAKTVIGRTDRIRLLHDQLPTFVKSQQSARKGESKKQSDQSEYRALNGRQARHAVDPVLPQIAQAQPPTVVQQAQQSGEE